jgi:hypothetical protein
MASIKWEASQALSKQLITTEPEWAVNIIRAEAVAVCQEVTLKDHSMTLGSHPNIQTTVIKVLTRIIWYKALVNKMTWTNHHPTKDHHQ